MTTSDQQNWLDRAVHWRWTPHLILLVALSVRLVALGSKSFWSDEAYSWYLANQGWSDVWAGGGNDPHHPPLYYAVLHLIIQVSKSEIALRLPSVIASTLTVPLVYGIARRLTDRRVAVVAMALVALSPLDVWYAQEARQAAMATMFLALAVYGLARLDRSGRFVAAIALTLSLFTYYVAALAWAVILGMALIHRERRRLVIGWVLATSAALIPFLPMQGRHFVEGFDDLQVTTAPGQMAGLMELAGSPFAIMAFGAVGAVVASLALSRLSRRAPASTAIVVTAAFLATTAVAALPRLYTLKRILIMGWPLALVIVAVALWLWLPGRWRTAATAVALACSLLASVVTVVGIAKDDWRSAVATINDRAGPRDVTWVVVYTGEWGKGPYLYYDIDTPLVHEVDPELYVELARSVEGDIWIVASRTPRDPIPSSGPEEWLDQNRDVVDDVSLNRVAVKRYSEP